MTNEKSSQLSEVQRINPQAESLEPLMQAVIQAFLCKLLRSIKGPSLTPRLAERYLDQNKPKYPIAEYQSKLLENSIQNIEALLRGLNIRLALASKLPENLAGQKTAELNRRKSFLEAQKLELLDSSFEEDTANSYGIPPRVTDKGGCISLNLLAPAYRVLLPKDQQRSEIIIYVDLNNGRDFEEFTLEELLKLSQKEDEGSNTDQTPEGKNNNCYLACERLYYKLVRGEYTYLEIGIKDKNKLNNLKVEDFEEQPTLTISFN